ncbi:MAG: DUF3568 family protein [Verrucomicrobiales bacterium]
MNSRLQLIFFTGLLALLSLILLPGCAVVAVGAAGATAVAYAKGDLEADLNAPLTQTIAATDSALYYLRLMKVDEKRTVDGVTMTIRDPDDKKVVIRLSPTSPSVTHISIRVDTFGNEARSNQILSEIEYSLY